MSGDVNPEWLIGRIEQLSPMAREAFVRDFNTSDPYDTLAKLRATIESQQREIEGLRAASNVQLAQKLAYRLGEVRAELMDREWRAIETAPQSETASFLVLRPGNSVCKALVVQVACFEGNLYADHEDGNIDWSDRIVDATHWMPLPPPPSAQSPHEAGKAGEAG